MRQVRRLCILLGSAAVLLAFHSIANDQAQRLDLGHLHQGRDIFYDQYGLIVHKGGDGKPDGGDTAQREGWYWLGIWVRQHTPGLTPWTPPRKLNFDQVLNLLEPKKDGVFYRHPKLPPWNNPYSKEWGTSRDQLVPLIAAMGVYGKTEELNRLWNALPEDALGKHAFNGNWRNFLGQDGPDCSAILKRGCDATANCSLRQDNRDCSLSVDTRDCSLAVDTRDCSQPHDERNCGNFLGIHDPVCEAAKAAQNVIYDTNRGNCEAAKAAQNLAYSTAKAACESGKSSQNALYASQKATCEAGKTAQNAGYAAEKLACESAKTTGKFACEADKQAAYQTCRLSNIFNGDLIGPSVTNLFRRAVNQNPMIPNFNDLNSILPSTVFYNGAAGEGELLINTHIRIGKAHNDPDDVGDDLNLIVQLVMAKLRFPTPISDNAAHEYAVQRAHSYGSFFDAYYARYGDDLSDFEGRIKSGIAAGWIPDNITPACGAVRWYHRPNSGANPQLATLFCPIIDIFIR